MRVAGIILIFILILAYDHSTAFPGATAILPVPGTALLIYASPLANDFATAFLSSIPMVYIGRISYSWYLWHWPILVFIRTYYPDANTIHMSAGVIISLVFAVMSYHFVEIPIRCKTVLSKKQHMYGLFGATLVVFMVAGNWGYLTDGLPQRFSEEILRTAENKVPTPDIQKACIRGNDWATTEITKLTNNQVCVLGNAVGKRYDFMVIGDSHALATLHSF